MNIQILAQNNETPEYEKALLLKEIFEDWLSSRNGKNDEIIIIPNLRLYGQETVDLDVLLIANLDIGVSEKVNFYSSPSDGPTTYINHNVYFSSFICAIQFRQESYNQTVPNIIQENGSIWLLANNRKANLSEYTNRIGLSAKNFLETFIGQNSNAYIVPIINFENLPFKKHPSDPNLSCFIRGSLTIEKILNAIVLRNQPKFIKNYYLSSAFHKKYTELNQIRAAVEYFSRVKNEVGELTKQKLDAIVTTRKDLPKYHDAVGKELLVLRGGAGTGKTIKLLQLAKELYDSGNRCLILTYNRALVQDIARLLSLISISDKPCDPTIEIKTIHSFLFPILNELTDWQLKFINDELKPEEQIISKNELYKRRKEPAVKKAYSKSYLYYLTYYKNLLFESAQSIDEFIEDDLVYEKSITNSIKAEYDYVLIDEAQDWEADERNILYKIFKSQNIIVAEGMQQLIRTHNSLNWTITKGQRVVNTSVTFPQRSLRQKGIHCKFQKAFAPLFGVPWEIERNNHLSGGQIWVYTGDFNEYIANLLRDYTKGFSKDKYDDILFLTPGQFTNKQVQKTIIKRNGKKEVHEELTKRSFSLIEEWKSFGITIHDLTHWDITSKSQPEPGEYRVINYESCRGLESYAVVALEMDTFFESKVKHFKDENDNIKQGDLFVQSPEERAKRYAAMWALIVFSRPVDLLLITIKSKESQFFMFLNEIESRNPGILRFMN